MAGNKAATLPAGSYTVDELLPLLLDPPRITNQIPGIGGHIRARPEDFQVEEIPAYAADGQTNAHALVPLRKRDCTTQDAARWIADHLGISRTDIGIAGLKDRNAVTAQWISVPWSKVPALPSFHHPQVQLGTPLPHGNKLRRGHLRGNRFDIVVRGCHLDVDVAATRVADKLTYLRAHGGMANRFGEQRFARDGGNVAKGLAALGGRRRPRRGDFLISVGQAVLFNVYLDVRREAGVAAQVVEGDILKKTTTGGLFICDDAILDEARRRSGEVVITGPIFGSRMMSPPAGTRAHELEQRTLARMAVTQHAVRALGRAAPGTRRATHLTTEVAVTSAAADPAHNLGQGLRLRFSLPAGSYATVLLHELLGPD